MTHYSSNPGLVRVSLFKSSDKWYADGAVDMTQAYAATCIHDGLYRACTHSYEADDGSWPVMSSPYEWLMNGGTIVCLEPYHIYAHPVMLTSGTAGLTQRTHVPEAAPQPEPCDLAGNARIA